MSGRAPWLLLLGLLAAAPSADAKTYTREGLVIEDPTARPSPPGTPDGPVGSAALLILENRGATPMQLVAASSPAAGEVELHQKVTIGRSVRTRRVLSLNLNPGDRLDFTAAGEYRLVLVGIRQKLRDGDSFPLVLEFDKLGPIEVTVEVKYQDYTHVPQRPKARP